MLKRMERLARLMAIVGGVVLTALVILTCLSILGRSLNGIGHSDWLTALSPWLAEALLATGVGPINGDFELVEAGVAFAIFAFLPVCQLYGGHATVDVFTSLMSRRVNKLLVTLWELVLSALIVLITARLYEGMMNKMSYGETSFLLQFPVWWAYGLSFVAAVVASIVAVYCAAARVLELITGRKFMPLSEGAVH